MGLKTGKESSKASESFQYIAQSYCLCKTCLATQLPTAISLSEWEVKRYRGNWWGFKKKAFNTHLSLTDWFWFTYSCCSASEPETGTLTQTGDAVLSETN